MCGSVILHISSGLEIRVVLWPRLPKLLQDHQIDLGGGPVVYWKTHHKKQYLKKKLVGPDDFYAFISCSVNVMYCKDCSNALQEKINYVRCDKQVLTVSYIRTTRNLAGPPDIQDWWSDGPLPRIC